MQSSRSRALVAASIGAITLGLAMSVYAAVRVHEARLADAERLGADELRSAVMSLPGAGPMYPHAVRDVAYVLNPEAGAASWHAIEEYPVNELGLRGGPIQPTERTRVVLVGDSMVFGWDLAEADRLELQLEARSPDLDVVTVALPGWNTRNQAAFLEHHRDLLDPDVLVWGLMPNDVEDSKGVVPPGILADWASPERLGLAPFRHNPKSVEDVPMPTLLERWQANAARIDATRDLLQVPTVRFWWRGEDWQQAAVPGSLRVPRELTQDERWNVDATDAHPSAWATGQVADAILGELAELGLAAAVEGAPSLEPAVDTPDLHAGLDELPHGAGLEHPQGLRAAWFGARHKDGAMDARGVLFLQAPNDVSHLVFEVDLASRCDLGLTVRDQDGVAAHQGGAVGPGPTSLRVPLPDGGPFWEAAWVVGDATCAGPTECTQGTLQRVGFE